MPNLNLPPEILDYIVDFLHDDPNALKGCCLVSKSWIPPTRKRLFAEVELHYEVHLESWKKTFPDPSTSPAHFTKSLHVGCASAVATMDAEAGGWLTGFDNIVHLGVEVRGAYGEPGISLVPFHRFSRTIKSLRVKSVHTPPSQIFDFILSSPLLEDLNLVGRWTSIDDGDSSDGPLTSVQTPNPPAFTGSLRLFLERGMKPVVSRLLSIPGGVRFRNLKLTWNRAEDLSSTTELVWECSHTLESLAVTCYLKGIPIRYLHPHR